MKTQSRTRGRILMNRVRQAAAGALLMVAAACHDEPTSTAVPAVPESGREGKYHVGYVLGPDGKPVKILFEVMGTDAVVEGDIVIGAAADVPRTPEAARKAGPAGPHFSLAVSSTARYWAGGVVPYQFASSVPASTRAIADSAMALITRRIDGVTFVETTSTASPYMRIENDNESGKCSATVGRASGGVSVANINGCGPGTTAHEFMHVLGFHHEHRRCDRDSYIDITSTLAADASWSIRCGTDVTYVGSTYDLLSIMHYDPEPGFNGSKVDLWLRHEGVDASTRIGQRDSLSSCDNYALDQIYPSTGTPACSRPYQSFASFHTLSSYWSSERGLIFDEQEPGFTMSGSWGDGGASFDYADDHYYTTSDARGWYTFEVPTDTVYNFYVWTFQKAGRTPATAVYKLYRGTPSQISSATFMGETWEWDQSQGSGWAYINVERLTAGTYTLQIQRKSGTTGTIFADAIRVTRDDKDPVH